jgi:hypothetical protein
MILFSALAIFFLLLHVVPLLIVDLDIQSFPLALALALGADIDI